VCKEFSWRTWKSWKISGRIRASNLSKDNVEELCLEGWQEALQGCTQVDEFCGRTLGPPWKSSKGRDGWSGSCVEDLQNPVSRWICQRSEEVTAVFGVQALGIMSLWIVDQLPVSRLI
jgi:hypothetical protein